MAKLPTISPRHGVASLGRENLGAPARLAGAEAAQARAVTRLGYAAMEGMRVLMEREDERAVEDAVVKYEKQRGEWLAEMSVTSHYKAEDVPDELGIEKSMQATDDYGRTRTVGRELIPAEEVAVSLYDMRMRGLNESLSANLANDNQRRMFARHAEINTIRGRNHMLTRAAAFKQDTLRTQRLETIDSLVSRGLYEKAIAMVQSSDPAVLDVNERGKLTREIQELSVTQPIYRAKAAQDMAALERELVKLESGAHQHIDPQRQAILANDLRADIRAIETRKKAELAEYQAKNFHQYRVRISDADPSMGRDVIEQAHKNGLINDSQWDMLVRYLNDQKSGKTDRSALYLAYLESGRKVPPEDTEAQKAFDEAYEAVYAQVEAGNVTHEQLGEYLVGIAGRNGHVPKPARNHIGSLILSDKPEDVMQGVGIYNVVRAAAPHAVERLMGGDRYDAIRARAELVNQTGNALEAINITRGISTESAEKREAYAAGFRQEYPQNKVEDAVVTLMEGQTGWAEGWLTRSPGVRGAMVAQIHARGAELAVLTGGNNQAALSAAAKEVLGQWGLQTSGAGGRRVAHFSVDEYAGDPDAVMADLGRVVPNWNDSEGNPLTPDDVYVEADAQTAREYRLNQPVSWLLIEKERALPLLDPRTKLHYRYRPNVEAGRAATRQVSVDKAEQAFAARQREQEAMRATRGAFPQAYGEEMSP